MLHVVDELPENVSRRSISDKVGRSVASVNFALRLLAAKGFIKISGAGSRMLNYSLTPQGVLHKLELAYDFLRQQRALYDEVRNDLPKNREKLVEYRAERASIYGWPPLTETAILYLMLEGISVNTVYVEKVTDFGRWNRVPIRPIEEFDADCDVLVLIEPLPKGVDEKISVRKLECYPDS